MMIVSPCAEEEYEKSIDARIENHTVITADYQKFSKSEFTLITGTAVKTNEVPFLVILDFDINKRLPEDERNRISMDLISKFASRGARIVRSPHGGLHVYCNQGGFELVSNREIKCYKCQDYDLDLFGCEDPSKGSIVLLPGSQIRDSPDAPILEYKIVCDPPGGVLTLTVAEALTILQIELPPVTMTRRKGKKREKCCCTRDS
jgi:hypothetical protein